MILTCGIKSEAGTFCGHLWSRLFLASCMISILFLRCVVLSVPSNVSRQVGSSTYAVLLCLRADE